jgi:L-iditol 2-dehydrogenase
VKRVMVDGINRIAVRDMPVPEPNDQQVLVKTGMASICSLTDLHIVEGRHPAAGPYPSIIGHEGAGTIVSVGKGVPGYREGDRVACKGLMSGCLSEYCAVGLDDLFKIPDSVSFEAATVMEIASCAYAMVRQCVKLGDRVLVIGQGCAGLLGTIFAKVAGAAEVAVSDPSAYKRDQALRRGADIAIDPTKEDLAQRCKEITAGRGFDAVFEFVGLPATIASTVDLIRERGTIGVFGACCEKVPFDFLALHYKFGRILTTGHEYAYNKVPYEKMLEFQLSGQLDFAEFVTHKIPITDAEKGFDLIRKKEKTLLRIGLLPVG